MIGCFMRHHPLMHALSFQFLPGGLMQEALRQSRAQYANIEESKTAQTILSHPKSPMS
jgi:hypothetical protein